MFFSRGQILKKNSKILSTFLTLPEHYKDPILTKNFAPQAIFLKKKGQKYHYWALFGRFW